jgi:hypothetical protein
VVAGGDDIARFTFLDILFCSFLDFGIGWIIADMYTFVGNGLRRFVFDIPDQWLPYHALYPLALLLGLVPWLLAVLRMFCNPSLGDWKLFCHLGMYSECGTVRKGCLPLMGRGISASPVCSCPCDTLYFRLLLCLSSRILRLPDCTLCGCPCCGICAFGYVACLVRRIWVNVPFCYYKHLLHL